MADNISITCPVCFRHCRLEEGQTGNCLARANHGGKSVSLNYGLLTALALDPIEKKPLAMFHPGSWILSAGSFGCNLHCSFCQNWQISQEEAETEDISPEGLADLAEREKKHGNIGIAYTYNEPTIGYEFIRDTAMLIRERGMKNVLVTNGSVTVETLRTFLPYIDAMNIDLKSFSEAFYRKMGGDLETVKAFIQEAARACHVEITTLIVTNENDTEEEMEALSSWIASIDPDIPLHVTRFFPRYQMTDRPAADIDNLLHLCETARKHLKYVFPGNI